MPDDEQSVELQALLGSMETEALVTQVTGVTRDHPLYEGLVTEFRAAATSG